MNLTRENLLEGAKKALENADELIQEANLLFNNKFYARAFTLFQLSMEETGKASLMFQSILFQTYESTEEKKTLLKEIRNHKIKTDAVQRMDLIIALCMEDKELKKTLVNNFKLQEKNIDKINDYKNYSLYVSDVNDSFVKPSEKIGKKLANDFKFYAKIRHSATKQFQDFLLLHLEKFIKYMETVDITELAKTPSPDMAEIISIMEGK